MLYYARYISNGKIYVSSDKTRGIIKYPTSFKQLIYAPNSPDAVKIMGAEFYKNGVIKDFNDLSISKSNKVLKYWSINEQISYFLGTENYKQHFGQMPSTVKVLSFDIEIASVEGQAPNHNLHRILSIGISVPGKSTTDYTVEIIDEKEERDTIIKFLDRVREVDPDIIAGYYSKVFDIPFIFGRMKILNIEFPESLHRFPPSAIKFSKYENNQSWETHPRYATLGLGRVHYDLFNSVVMDTSIKTKNLRLKTIAAFFKSETIYNIEDEEKSEMLKLYENDKERYYKYLESDIHQNMVVFNAYFLHNANMSIMVDCSLDALINANGRAPFARMFMSRAFIAQGIYPAFTNKDRNEQLYEITKDGSYRGAYTGIRKLGVFDDVCKVDFKSMYPSIIVSFNISPDTVKYVGSADLIKPPPGTKAKYKLSQLAMDDDYYPIKTEVIERTKDGKVATLRVAIPDTLLNKYIYIDINQTKKGIIAVSVDELFILRDKLKAKMKQYKEGSFEYILLDSQQMGVKIANNSNYGIFGNQHLDVGDLACAMLVTGFGREITHACISMIGEDVIEIDTDGYYASRYIDSNDLNNKLKAYIDEKYPDMPFDSRMILETEKQGMNALFLGMKNYIIKNPKTGELEATGSSLKGSSKSIYVERLVLKTAKLLMEKELPLKVRAIIDDELDKIVPPDEFKISMRIKRKIDEFDKDGGILEYKRRILAQPRLTIKESKVMLIDFIKKTLGNSEWLSRWELLVKQDTDKVIHKTKHNILGIMFNATELLLSLYDIETKRETPSIFFRILASAYEKGIQVMPGETIEYYMSAEDFTLYSNKNLKQVPINKIWYNNMINKVVSKMISAVHNQINLKTDGDLF